MEFKANPGYRSREGRNEANWGEEISHTLVCEKAFEELKDRDAL